MSTDQRRWWTKEPGVKYLVEVTGTTFNVLPQQMLPTDPNVEKAVLVRVLAGVHRGMYALVDESRLSAYDE